jgi:hypothetical protein
MARGLPIDVSLQKAKMEFIETGTRENRLPYFWAAPVLIGKTNAMYFRGNFLFKNVISDVGALLLFSLLICMGLLIIKKTIITKAI